MNYMRMLRQYVGTDPIILPGAAVILLNEKGEILLQKRVDDGLWGIREAAWNSVIPLKKPP